MVKAKIKTGLNYSEGPGDRAVCSCPRVTEEAGRQRDRPRPAPDVSCPGTGVLRSGLK